MRPTRSRLTLGDRLDAPGLVAAGTAPGKFNGMATKVCAMRTAAPVRQLDLTLTLRMEQDKDPAGWGDGAPGRRPRGRRRTRSRARPRPGGRTSGTAATSPSAGPVASSTADKPWLAARNYQLVRASSRPTRRGGP
ncbi:MAG: hypothetical protein U1G05_19245 [Kiritimatiellia bacterium]